jgi:prophage regulatory protein
MNAFTGQTFQMNQIINLKEVMLITGLSRATIYNIMDERHKQYDPTFPKQTNLTVGRVGWLGKLINGLNPSWQVDRRWEPRLPYFFV